MALQVAPRIGRPDARRELTLAELISLVWHRRWQFVGAALLGFLIGFGGSYSRPKKYESRASFIGVTGSSVRLPANLGALGALAGQLGLTPGLGADGANLSPFFYADLLTANTILTQLATATLPPTATGTEPAAPIYVILGVRGRTRADSIDRAARRLRRLIVVDIQPRTGVIKVSITAAQPHLATGIGDTLLALVNAFVGRDLRTRAGAQRRFLQERLAEVEGELREQRDRLRAFLESNRGDYRQSPALLLREQELQRDLDLKRDLFLSVSRSLEEARMNEVRDTPLLSIIDRPSVPLRPRSPRPRINGILLAMFMPVLWLAIVLLRRFRNTLAPHEA